jgi:predicted RNase H-like nuclease (RuvC/YqgF family)
MDIPVSGDGVFDQKFYDFFQGIIKDNNIPGIDYFEYREALKKMKALPENSAFQMAFDNFKIIDGNLTKETILASIDHYDGLLASEEKDFDAEMIAETEREVTARRQKATDLQTENKDILQQITNLQEKISHNQEEAINLNNEAALAEVKIGQTGKNFTKTLTHVRTQLDTDKTKFGQLVQETKTA